ncbi:hypothetical protein [Meiothermus ruber]|jgi:hypothetical protein|uniref:Uncharacterized protein n=1 Tax=Meiothermus ruber (strain ATCC 35948 / DSM 1279 / VKM B-1258 / 21) TaxID=504728 RepID=D3PMT6_MEIRD|nr:hypothetical protein [Meiothermus ruber]ADD27261.1 hypothetical protein Mrub_0484 [Meiothermus ruber DSM 1279]AGK03713.1 hypothetical protein K649_02045 [Meiothermus ruber DSM 1279]MCL6530039.1 hypothetical protein [Meiothermus ruber]MCX7802297.1 hypothetical protein [Meiothermus ruber]GAO74186.1 putative uncharacterized protein [Meiothermus ruber H328]
MTGDKSVRDWAAIALGAVVLLGFAALVVYMLGLLTADETTWGRALYLFAGVEAIAFAAAGYLFGREVHRARAEQAEARAHHAEEQWQRWSRRALEAEAKGQSLSTTIALWAQQHPELAPAAQMAQRLFPDRP